MEGKWNITKREGAIGSSGIDEGKRGERKVV